MNWNYSESFAGIGAWGKAIKRVSERHDDTCELKWFAEIDKYAINSFCAIHDEPESKNIVDITKDIDVEEVDVFFYSPPCQTFSIAGKREGTNVDKGNLFYNALDKLKKSNPKYAIMENIKGLPSGDTKEDFNNMIFALDDAGYFSYWKILNSKDYGIPQNRERVFIVSIRKDVYNKGKRFEFPKKNKLEKNVKDYADYKMEVPKKILNSMSNKTGDFSERFKTLKGNSHYMTLIAKSGYAAITNSYYTEDLKRYDIEDIIKKDLVVYAVSPEMSFLLQGFTKKDYKKASSKFVKDFNRKSDNQMYRRSGNSITVNVIEEILENLLYDRKQIGNQLSMV